MFTLPEKKSQKWVNLIAILLTLNLVGLLLSRILVGQALTFQNILAFVILACAISVFFIPGYLGFQIYTLSVIIGDSAGMLYLFYLVLTKKNDGWIDLTSIFSFLSLVIIGIATGVIAQLVTWLLSRRNETLRN